MHNKEGVNQRDPLDMITYGIGVLTIIRELREAHPCITQPWYAYDAGAGRELGRILAHFQDLQTRGPPQGYLPEPTNSILVMSLRNLEMA